MGILIAIVVITLVVAAVGAGVYVLIFRLKHKKEVKDNSQMMGGGVPIYGQPQDQQAQGQPDFTNNMTAETSQPVPAPSPMMNDIMGNGSTNDNMTGTPQAPQPPVQDPSVETPQEVQPSISQDFAPETAQPEVPADNIPSTPSVETPTLDNTLDLNQPGPQNTGEENILDDTQTVAPITEMAKEDMGQTPDGDMADFSVPATKEGESLEQEAGSELGEVAVSAQNEDKVEQTVIPEPTVAPPDMQAEPMNAPEPPVVPEPPVSNNIPLSQPPVENAVPTQDGMVASQDKDTKEMNI